MSSELKPVAYQSRWYDNDPYTVTYGQWYDWENKSKQSYDDINEMIKSGKNYETRALYAIPEGMQLVPIEPTEAMLRRLLSTKFTEESTMGDVYKAMLKAAKEQSK